MPAAETGAITLSWSLLLKYVWAPFIGLLIWFGKSLYVSDKEKTTEIIELQGKVKALEEHSISEERIRVLIKEAMTPLYEDMSEVSSSIKALAETVVQLRIDLARANALKDGV